VAGLRGGGGVAAMSVVRRAALVAGLAVVLAAAGARAADGEDAESAAAASAADTTTARRLLSTDGAIRVYEELRPGEGINGFWWEYDKEADLSRLLDEDARDRKLDQLTDAFGFQIVAPETILALRDSVVAVADSIRAARIEVRTVFDPKVKSRYSENRDNFDFVNEIVSPIPLGGGTLQTSLTNTDSFNESTRKIRDGRAITSSFSHQFRSGVTTSLSFNRSDDQQRRDRRIESRSDATGVTGRILATRTVDWLGEVNVEGGVAGNRTSYETDVTDGRSDLFAPSWSAGVKRPVGSGTVSFDYDGRTEVGTRREVRNVPALDSLGVPQIGPDGTPLTEEQVAETEDSNRSNRLDFNATGDLTEVWSFRLGGSVTRNRLQFIAQAESLAGQQETRNNDTESVTAQVEGKPVPSLDVKVDGRMNRNEFDYALETAKFNETTSRGATSNIVWDPRKGTKVSFRLNRDREDRNFETAQAGIVDKEAASVDWKQTITSKVELTANYDVSLDSFVFDDKEANTGDRDLRNQRSVFTVRYNVTSAFTSAVRMDVRKNETINVSPAKSRDNKTDYAYVVTPDYTLRFAGNSLTGEFTADARYAVFDFDEERNFLTRRFATRQRWQRALTAHVSTDLLGTYEILDEGAYQPDADGIRRFAKSRETRRFRVETQMLYDPNGWLKVRMAYRRDGDDQYGVDGDEKTRTLQSRTDELTMGVSSKATLLRSIRLDVDVAYTAKDGDRVTDVDRRFFNILASLEYQPFQKPEPKKKGNGS